MYLDETMFKNSMDQSNEFASENSDNSVVEESLISSEDDLDSILDELIERFDEPSTIEESAAKSELSQFQESKFNQSFKNKPKPSKQYTTQTKLTVKQKPSVLDILQTPIPSPFALKKTSEDNVQKEKLKIEEKERLEAERFESERVKQEKLEQDQLEQERLETERITDEFFEAERVKAERIEKEIKQQEKREAERLVAEKIEKQEIEAKRIDAEKQLQKKLLQKKRELEQQ